MARNPRRWWTVKRVARLQRAYWELERQLTEARSAQAAVEQVAAKQALVLTRWVDRDLA